MSKKMSRIAMFIPAKWKQYLNQLANDHQRINRFSFRANPQKQNLSSPGVNLFFACEFVDLFM